jgi:hypothetical protein
MKKPSCKILRENGLFCSSESVNDAQVNRVKRMVTVRSSTARELPAQVFRDRSRRNHAIRGVFLRGIGIANRKVHRSV